MKIVFMGTPEFAVASLKKLTADGFDIAAVVTAPDKPAGRGLKPTSSAVKKYAASEGIPILQPPKLKDPSFVEELRAIKADLFVVVAFRMLPEVVWDMPPMGTINLHGSLLPQYRGAAPIHWAIINGETETGVTTFKLKHEIDTGNILLQEKIDITPNETAGSLHDKMKDIGAGLLAKTLHQLQAGKLKAVPQTTGQILHHAPKIHNEICEIKWDRSAGEIDKLVRGLSPVPAAYTFLDDKKFKLFAGKPEKSDHNLPPGKVVTDGKNYLKFAVNNGFYYATEVQLEGKKRMGIESFLRGYKPPAAS